MNFCLFMCQDAWPSTRALPLILLSCFQALFFRSGWASPLFQRSIKLFWRDQNNFIPLAENCFEGVDFTHFWSTRYKESLGEVWGHFPGHNNPSCYCSPLYESMISRRLGTILWEESHVRIVKIHTPRMEEGSGANTMAPADFLSSCINRVWDFLLWKIINSSYCKSQLD